jgi:hypothetical protein
MNGSENGGEYRDDASGLMVTNVFFIYICTLSLSPSAIGPDIKPNGLLKNMIYLSKIVSLLYMLHI